MTTSERVAYLKGLAEGLGLDKENKQDRLIAAIIDVLEDVALDLEDLEAATLDLGEELDAISDDLTSVEELVYDEYEDYDEDDYEDCCCGHDHDHHHHDHGDSCCGGGDHGDSCCGGGDHGDSCCGGGDHDHHHGDSCCCGHDEPVFYEVTCPACENTITIDEDVLALGKIDCPNCGEALEFDMDSIDDEDAPSAE